MTNLQEAIFRGRFIFADAPGRLDVFECVNGKRNTSEIAALLKRHRNNVRRDLLTIQNAGLIQPLFNGDKIVKKDNFPVYEVVPLVRTIPIRYFREPIAIKRPEPIVAIRTSQPSSSRPDVLQVPSETDVLDIARQGENQFYEFKAPGTEANKITREIGAMLNTKHGGIILYGIDDDGTIIGSDVSSQELDQPLQNSIRSMISPAATIFLHTVDVMGTQILAIVVPPWDRKTVFQHSERILLRKGTNVMAARPEEVKKLHDGSYII